MSKRQRDAWMWFWRDIWVELQTLGVILTDVAVKP